MRPRFFKRGKRATMGAQGVLRQASMRPRFFKRGKAATRAQPVAIEFGFNEATLFQAWKVKCRRDKSDNAVKLQ